jgi:hypothetical protein
MKNIVVLFVVVSFFVIACDRKPYVEHKLKFEKVADDCSEQQSYFRLNSNFGGERYEFEKCLPPDFKSDQLTSRRSGDTVYVAFKTGDKSVNDKVYHLTLDIDSYPRYNFITIESDTYAITSSQN